MELLQHNLAVVEGRVAAAAARCGRDPTSVRILPVTKGVSTSRLLSLASLGYRQMVEGRVQELVTKSSALDGVGVDWVGIGHLQTNKVGTLAGLVSEFHAVDSLRVAQALSSRLSQPLDVFIQVNTSGEAAKFGFSPNSVASAVSEIVSLPQLRVRGLMTMARRSPDPSIARTSFRMLRELSESLGLIELSMGMSGDFEIAIEEGATTVRIGSLLFGPQL